jgi:hypothetical protein
MMRCPKCRDQNLVTAQCAPTVRVPGCAQDGDHEHHACSRCDFAWVGDPPASAMTSAGIEEFVLAVFDQIIGHRPRKSK